MIWKCNGMKQRITKNIVFTAAVRPVPAVGLVAGQGQAADPVAGLAAEAAAATEAANPDQRAQNDKGPNLSPSQGLRRRQRKTTISGSLG